MNKIFICERQKRVFFFTLKIAFMNALRLIEFMDCVKNALFL